MTMSGENAPPGWKALDDFAAGIDGNRMKCTDALAGTSLTINALGRPPVRLDFHTLDELSWKHEDGTAGTDWYEAIEVRPGLFYLTITDTTHPLNADVVIIDRNTGRTLTVESVIADAPTPGKPRVSQNFRPGVLDGVTPTGDEAAPSRDLIGLRALYRYSPHHLYEHVYLSSERYAWQCLVGEQRGHGDVDLATTWRFAEDLYVFTFREFLIPVAATWLYDMKALRTTGTFVGLRGDGRVMVAPGGAFITLLGRVTYEDEQPV
nr:molybdenum cofactor biosynthesis F family protein [Kibdelosporangium sp. MJ126-NF4]CEL14280.1 MoaF protein precursor [Kibdelosporangium sp. MJ126-NF4]CTQ88647.1 MoaF protein precursor [Kibdelosporangium sp. MJ126-NF4]